jgi:hypothetical protein
MRIQPITFWFLTKRKWKNMPQRFHRDLKILFSSFLLGEIFGAMSVA